MGASSIEENRTSKSYIALAIFSVFDWPLRFYFDPLPLHHQAKAIEWPLAGQNGSCLFVILKRFM